MRAPRVFYREEGSGPPLVLLNGVMMSALGWTPLVSRLRDAFRVVSFDFRGQMLTPGEPPDSLEGHAEDLLALLDALELERAHLVGASFGAAVATLFAARHPERTRSLVALTGAPSSDERLRQLEADWGELARQAAAGGARRPLFEKIFEAVYPAAFRREAAPELEARLAQVDALPDRYFAALEKLMGSALDFDLRPELARIEAPTLVVAAELDEVVRPERCRELAEAIAGARFETIERAGHGLILERPEAVAALVREFCARA